MSNISNPFNPGAGLMPPYLAGRDAEIERFSNMLNDVGAGKVGNILMQGLRGMGKTVLLQRFEEICLDRGFLPIKHLQYNEQQSNPDEFINILKNDLERAIQKFSKLEKAKRQLQHTANFVKPKKVGIAADLVTYEPSYDSSSKPPFEDQIADHLVKKWKPIGENYEGVVFLFDEFHTIQNIKSKGWYTLTSFIGAINNLQIDGYKYSLVLSGLPTLSFNVKNAHSYSERMFKFFQISKLNEEASRQAITEPLKKTNWSFSDDLVSLIVQDADQYPFFIQLIAKKVIDYGGKNKINLGDYERIHSKIIRDLGNDFFDQRMESLSVNQRNLLQHMVELPNSDLDFAAIQSISDLPKGTLGKELQRLIEKGIVYRHRRGTYRFGLVLFKNIF